MAKQWVDITTIDNVTPFTKVRWKSSMSIPSGDAWFAEASGLTTEGMSWTAGNTAALGYFGGHRMNSYAYTCSMNCEQYDIDQSTIAYRVAVKDEPRDRAGFYDSAVAISGETYYEVDFSLWENASGKSLYMPYAVAPWTPGDILVEIESGPIKLDKNSMSFRATGGSQTVTVTAADDWTASASSAWITVSVLSGASGTSVVTISTPNYADTTTGRTGSVTFTCSGDTAVLSVSQRKASSGSGGIFIGAVAAEAMYIGNTEVSAMYIGENLVFPTESNTVIRYIAPAQVVPNVAYSDSAWTLTLTSDTYDSATSAGTVTFSGTGLTIPDGAFSATTISEVTIGKGAVSLGDFAFSQCADLVSFSLPKTLTTMGQYTFGVSCTALTEAVIPDQVTSLGIGTFVTASALASASLPSGLTSIPDWTFRACGLTGFTIPEGVTQIGERALEANHSLTAITIPSGVTEIGAYAFNNSGLLEITFNGSTPPTAQTAALNMTSTAGTIYCPAGSESAYEAWITGLTGQNISGWTVYKPVEPLTIEFTTAGAIGWSSNFKTRFNLQYSLNGGEWARPTATTSNLMPVQAGDVLQLRASGTPTGDIAYNATPMKIEGGCKVRGYYTSLEDPDFTSVTAMTHYAAPLFKNATGLTDASGLIMPPITFTNQHWNMFVGCTSLVAAPQLPATSLSKYCYCGMFSGCTSLQTAPELPAPIVPQGGYSYMFSGCTSLNYIKCLTTDRTATDSTLKWVSDVGSTGTFYKDANYTEWSTGDNGIPSGWTVIDV